jgi:hypothetical protein
VIILVDENFDEGQLDFIDELTDIASKDAVVEAIRELYNDIRTYTEISEMRIYQTLRLNFYREAMNLMITKNDFHLKGLDIVKIIDDTKEEFYNLSISKKRKGREEFFDAIATVMHSQEKPSIVDRILRRA